MIRDPYKPIEIVSELTHDPVDAEKMLPIREPRIMTTPIESMIETLAAAKTAMEENPHLKATIAELEDMLNKTLAEHEALAHDHESTSRALTAAMEQIESTEAELEQARFRELAVGKKLNKLVSSFNAAISEVDPQPMAQSGPKPTMVHDDATVLELEQGNDKLQATIDEHTTAIEPSSTEVEAEREFKATEDSLIEEASEMLSQPNTIASVATTPPQIERTAKAEQPYAGLPFSFKPDRVTWPEWVDGGGNRPWWLTDVELAKQRTLVPEVAQAS